MNHDILNEINKPAKKNKINVDKSMQYDTSQIYTLDLPPTQDASHYQDSYILNREMWKNLHLNLHLPGLHPGAQGVDPSYTKITVFFAISADQKITSKPPRLGTLEPMR